MYMPTATDLEGTAADEAAAVLAGNGRNEATRSERRLSLIHI